MIRVVARIECRLRPIHMRSKIAPLALALALGSSAVVGGSGCGGRSAHTRIPSGEIQFGGSGLERGDIVTRIEQASMEGKLRAGARRARVEIHTSEKQVYTLLRAKNGAPSALRVLYADSSSRSSDRLTGSDTDTSPVHHNIYDVDATGPKFKVTTADGGKPSLAEYFTVFEDFGPSGTSLPFLESLVGQTVRFGEVVRENKPDQRVDVKLVDQRNQGGRRVAVFELEMSGSQDGADFKLEGEALIDIDSAVLLRLSAEGPFQYGEPGAKAKGRMVLSVTNDVRRL